MKDFFTKIKERWQTMLIIIFIIVAVTFSASIFIPAKYSSEIKMMIIQNHQSEKVDAFSAAKSAEYLSNIIANIVFTEAFMRDVFDAPFEIEKRFPNSSEEKMKVWERTVDIKKENNTGILNIEVLDKSQQEAEVIADSIAWALNVKGDKYHGGGESVQIKMIDGPITSERPAYPDVLLNTLLALLVGTAGAFSIIYFFDDFELILFSSNKKRKDEFEKDFNKQIVTKLEKIRENLKNQDMKAFVSGDYKIEDIKSFGKSKKLDEVEDISKKENEFINDDKELKKNHSIRIDSKKNKAPQNLPVFSNEKKEINSKDFISIEELDREAEKMGLNNEDKSKNDNDFSKYEASSDEVKERLNKLLKGEL